MDEYYVYAYLDPEAKGEYLYGDYFFEFMPIYIGKGKKSRYSIHLKKTRDELYTKRNTEFYKKIDELLNKKTPPIIIKIKENLTEEEAFNLEKKYISSIGRKIKNEGPLLNKTKGGNGFKGCNSYRGGFKKNHTELTKRKLSEYHKGKTFEDLVGKDKAKNWKEKISESNKGLKKKFSEESINNIRNIWLGKKMPDEIRMKMSEKKKGSVPWNKGKKIYQYNMENELISELLLHEIPKIFNIPTSNVIKCCKGERKSAGGYIWRYEKN